MILNIISLFFPNHPQVVKNFSDYIQEYEKLNFSLITYYEISSGLKHKDATKRLNIFLDFANYNNIIIPNIKSINISAQIYANLRKKGTPVDDINILIAGIAISNNLVLITHNQKHFRKIEGLEIEDWTES